jgi:uncharacterized damage-inducible protein DinB
VTWVAPHVERIDEPFAGDERATLEGYLDYGRASLLLKCAGLSGQQLALRACPPSTLSLLGLVRHITEVERTWFRRRFAGQDVELRRARPLRSEAAFDEADAAHAERDWNAFVDEQEQARRAVADLPLDAVFHSDRHGPMTLRWAYIHMITEYAQHNGHADLLRERIDGATGI